MSPGCETRLISIAILCDSTFHSSNRFTPGSAILAMSRNPEIRCTDRTPTSITRDQEYLRQIWATNHETRGTEKTYQNISSLMLSHSQGANNQRLATTKMASPAIAQHLQKPSTAVTQKRKE